LFARFRRIPRAFLDYCVTYTNTPLFSPPTFPPNFFLSFCWAAGNGRGLPRGFPFLGGAFFEAFFLFFSCIPICPDTFTACFFPCPASIIVKTFQCGVQDSGVLSFVFFFCAAPLLFLNWIFLLVGRVSGFIGVSFFLPPPPGCCVVFARFAFVRWFCADVYWWALSCPSIRWEHGLSLTLFAVPLRPSIPFPPVGLFLCIVAGLVFLGWDFVQRWRVPLQ